MLINVCQVSDTQLRLNWQLYATIPFILTTLNFPPQLMFGQGVRLDNNGLRIIFPCFPFQDSKKLLYSQNGFLFTSLLKLSLDYDQSLDKHPHPAIQTCIVRKSRDHSYDQVLDSVADPRPSSSNTHKEVKVCCPRKIADLQFKIWKIIPIRYYYVVYELQEQSKYPQCLLYTQPFWGEIYLVGSLSILTVIASAIYFVRGRYPATALAIANFIWTVA